MTDVYLAREEPDPDVSGRLVVDAVSDRGRCRRGSPSSAAAEYLAARALPGDVLLVLGAGSVESVPAILRERLVER